MIAHGSVGMEADGGDVELAARGPFVERLDVLQNVLETVAARRNQSLCQAIKHEGIVRIGRMAQRQSALRHARKSNAGVPDVESPLPASLPFEKQGRPIAANGAAGTMRATPPG